MMNVFRFVKTAARSLTAIGVLLAATAVSATPIVTGPAGGVSVGNSVVFTISDDNPSDGFDAGSGFYLADYLFNFDSAALQFVSGDAGPDPIFNAYLNAVGEVRAQYVWDLPAANAPLFTLTFLALEVTDPIGTALTLTQPADGVYGADGAVYGSATVFVPIAAASGPGGTVPEPPSLALVLLAGFLMRKARARGLHSRLSGQA